MRILIDPGHGGTDPGAVNDRVKLRESNVALMYALILRPHLADAGHQVSLSREADQFLSLPARVACAHDCRAHLFLSLHCNAAVNQAASGIELWTSVGQTASDDVATSLFGEIKGTFPDRKMRTDWDDGDPDKEANFYVLRHTRMPAVLLELEFLSNDAAAIWLRDYATVNLYCAAIARGVDAWDKSLRR
jgi:N-acetylmuramoyl-L-alanine amidase